MGILLEIGKVKLAFYHSFARRFKLSSIRDRSKYIFVEFVQSVDSVNDVVDDVDVVESVDIADAVEIVDVIYDVHVVNHRYC